MNTQKTKISLDWGEVEIVEYDEYKRIGGRLSKEEYERVLNKSLHVPQENFEKAFRFCGQIGQGYFPAPEMALLARILTIKPNISPFNAIAETLLLQGKR